MRPSASVPSRVGLEVCVDSASGIAAAVENGADRIELCAALSEGGLTPSKGMMELASLATIPVRAMIRPRGGNFVFGATEIEVMRRDIEQAASSRIEGVVLGCNTASGELEEIVLRTLVRHAQGFGLKVTLHRSFDLVPDPLHALAIAADLRIDTILTSGLQATAPAGIDVIAKLVSTTRSRGGRAAVEIMAGSGVTPSTVDHIVARTHVPFVHASCSRARPDNDDAGDLLGLYSPARRETDPLLIAQLRQAIDRSAQARLQRAPDPIDADTEPLTR